MLAQELLAYLHLKKPIVIDDTIQEIEFTAAEHSIGYQNQTRQETNVEILIT